jgi:peptidoglycan/xylan/chitin deacetylase (PgdA/CDA1 family)
MALRGALVSAAKLAIPHRILRQQLNRRGRGSVLLTFDDGPSVEATPRVLDVLDRWNARALFFVVGVRVRGVPHILPDIVKRGHRLGNHTFSHLLKGNIREYVNEIELCQQLVYDLTGHAPSYFRPPRGRVSVSGLCAAKYSGLVTVRWSFDCGEYSYLRSATPEQIADNMTRNVHDRAIVLSHDDNSRTAEMLALALPRLVEKGFDLNSGLDYLD